MPAILVAVLLAQVSPEGGPPGPPPNILLVLADNWAWPHASALGDPVVSTPHFDRLAADGLLLTHAFCQVPSCSPSRAVLLTGQPAHALREAASLWSSWPPSLRPYPEVLEGAGYAVGVDGKPWAPGVVFQLSSARRNRNPAGPMSADFAAFLDSLPDGQPFAFWFGSQNPHQPWRADRRHYAGLDESAIRLPAYLPDHPEVRQATLNYYAEVQAFDEELGTLLDELDRRGLREGTLVVVAGDNGWQVPRGLANVYDAGTRVPLAMRWPGTIAAGGVSEAMVSFEDVAPTFLAAAGLPIPKRMTGRPLQPLFDGVADPADGWPDAVFLERERHANVRAGDQSYPVRAVRTRDWLYVWNMQPDRWPAGDPTQHVAVGPFGDVDSTPFKTVALSGRDGGPLARFFELGFAKRPERELYDLRADPDQVANVAADPRHAERIASMHARLTAWMARTGDPRTADPDTTFFDEAAYFGGPPRSDRIAPAEAYRP